jgi:hypothetical protein
VLVKTVTYTLDMNGKKLVLNTSELDGEYAADETVEIVDLNGDGILDFLFVVRGSNLSIRLVDVASGKPEGVAGFYAGD